MRFIRDIIAERADGQTPEQDAAAEAANPAPAARPRTTDRTMTRLSDGTAFEGDDVFRRLLEEEENAKPDIAQDLDALSHVTPEGSEDDGEDPCNLFAANDDAEDVDAAVQAIAASSQTPASPETGDGVDVQDDPMAAPLILEHSDRMAEPVEPSAPAEADTAEHPAPPVAEALGTPKPGLPSMPGRAAAEPEAPTDEGQAGLVAVPAPASGRSGRGAGRVKTRLLGFGAPEDPMRDPFQETAPVTSVPAASPEFPVGWIVVVDGPGRGKSFTLLDGVSQIGRGDDQAIRLDFGDTSISRSNHAAVAYDAEQGGFYLGHGGKANMVRLNDRPVLSTEELHSGALIRIGETTLRFVAFCDADFAWTQEGAPAHATAS